MWRVPILADRPATWADAQQLTFDNAYLQHVDVSPGGDGLAVSSDRASNQDLWILPSEGGAMMQLTTDLSPDWAPRWSGSGEEIAFYSHRSGNRDIWVMPAGGGPAQQLTSHSAADVAPTWSPDGRKIAFLSGRSGNSDIWIVEAEGGEPRQLTQHTAYEASADWSPDGECSSSTRLERVSGDFSGFRQPAASPSFLARDLVTIPDGRRTARRFISGERMIDPATCGSYQWKTVVNDP